MAKWKCLFSSKRKSRENEYRDFQRSLDVNENNSEDQEEDGFVLLGETAIERTTVRPTAERPIAERTTAVDDLPTYDSLGFIGNQAPSYEHCSQNNGSTNPCTNDNNTNAEQQESNTTEYSTGPNHTSSSAMDSIIINDTQEQSNLPQVLQDVPFTLNPYFVAQNILTTNFQRFDQTNNLHQFQYDFRLEYNISNNC